MMNRSDIRVGMAVYFGRSQGEKSLGRVTKINRIKVMVEQVTNRGVLKDYPMGQLWAVPPSLLSPAPQESLEQYTSQPITTKEKGRVVDLGGDEPRSVKPGATMAPAAPSRRKVKVVASAESTPAEKPRKERKAKKAATEAVVATQEAQPAEVTKNRAKGYGSRRKATHAVTEPVATAPTQAAPGNVPFFSDPTNRLRIEGHPGESTEEFHARLGKILGNWEKRHKAEFGSIASKGESHAAHNVH